MDSHKDYYKTLNLSKKASIAEIKDSYKKLALKWHPDKNRHNPEESKKVFQRISEAYSILSDPAKRKKYDKYGTVEDFDFDYEQFMKEFDFGDMFDMMFGNMNSFFGHSHRNHRNTRNSHWDFEKNMRNLHKKEKKENFYEKNEGKNEKDWETEEENDDDFEDLSEDEENCDKMDKKEGKNGKNMKKKKGNEDIDMVYLPMFVAENAIEMKKKGFKCKFDGEIMSENQLFKHFEKEHVKELEKFIKENEDMGGMDDFGIDFLEEITNEFMNPMFLMGGMGKKKKKGFR